VTWEERVLCPGWEIWERLQPKDAFTQNVAIAFDGKIVHRMVFDNELTRTFDGEAMIVKDIVAELKRLGAFRERYEPS
jgi:hypothetical protein